MQIYCIHCYALSWTQVEKGEQLEALSLPRERLRARAKKAGLRALEPRTL